MVIKDHKSKGFYRNKLIFIDGVCHEHACHSNEFKEQLSRMIAYAVEPEYIPAIYDAMTSPDTLDRTAIDYCISKSQLSRKVHKCKANWDRFFKGWRFISGEDYKILEEYKRQKQAEAERMQR